MGDAIYFTKLENWLEINCHGIPYRANHSLNLLIKFSIVVLFVKANCDHLEWASISTITRRNDDENYKKIILIL